MQAETPIVDIPEGLEYWVAANVSECLPYEDFLPADYGAVEIATREGFDKPWHVLSRKLWDIQNAAVNPTPLGGDGEDGKCETPDAQMDTDNGDKTRQWWHLLTDIERGAIVSAWFKHLRGEV